MNRETAIGRGEYYHHFGCTEWYFHAGTVSRQNLLPFLVGWDRQAARNNG
jgi:catechol-2,3-dioxygenase